ncbi:hypothetical protein niasHT_035434 [Heterodera trifolii]|uniref:14-3-3 domain-containing protein n=1 Tax=Heterodera trifolii TaxID=157864 RepID=A0ABD2IIQ2_9BILA
MRHLRRAICAAQQSRHLRRVICAADSCAADICAATFAPPSKNGHLRRALINNGEQQGINLVRAKLADQAVRYYDMAQLMKKVVEMDNVLNEEERNMLSIAYKAVIRPLRFALREISPIEWTQDGTEKQLKMLKRYREKLVKELHDTCNELVELLDNLIPRAHDPEVKVFYLKMKADVYRYMAAEAIGGVVDKSRQAYQEAYDIAKDKLRPANATRLGLGLNFCIFYYDNLDMEENAIDFAKKARD